MRRVSRVPDAEITRSSVFEFQRHPTRDRGASVISLADAPSHVVRRGPKVQYENTFKMKPDTSVNYLKIQEIINNTLTELFQDVKYNYEEIGHLCKQASQNIKDEIKLLKFDRYKIVASVTVSEQTGQGIKQASRFLWDDKKDNWIDGYFANSSLVVHASAYALYYE